MNYIQKNFQKLWIISVSCCFFILSFPLQSHAETKTPEQENMQLPSFSGKLDLTPQVQKEISEKENKSEKSTLITSEAAKENLNAQKETEQETQAAQTAKQHPVTQEDVILAPGRHNSILMQEEGSNVMAVHGSDKIPENYTNSTNINNGFYMNITNPDGSGMNMGTYFNSNSNSNSTRKRSKAQIVIDKME